MHAPVHAVPCFAVPRMSLVLRLLLEAFAAAVESSQYAPCTPVLLLRCAPVLVRTLQEKVYVMIESAKVLIERATGRCLPFAVRPCPLHVPCTTPALAFLPHPPTAGRSSSWRVLRHGA